MPRHPVSGCAPSEPATPPITAASSSSKSSRSRHGRAHRLARAEDRVRVREVERRRLVPLRRRRRSCRRRDGADALDVLLERHEVADARRHERREQLHVGERARLPRRRPGREQRVRGIQTLREHVGDRQTIAGTRTTRSSMTKPSPMSRRPSSPARDPHARTSVSSSASALPPRMRARQLVRQPGTAHERDRIVESHVERVVAAEQRPATRRRPRPACAAHAGRARPCRTRSCAGTSTARARSVAPRGAPATRGRSVRSRSAGSRRRARRRS